MPEIHYSSILDLSHVVHPDMPRWPGDPPVEFASAAQIDADGFFLRRVSLGEHSGTHLNAPAHFFARGADASAIRPERLVLAGVVIDARRRLRTLILLWARRMWPPGKRATGLSLPGAW
jgi:kynurenine formamidase